MNYAEKDSNHLSNTSFIIGYYESMLKTTLNEIKEGDMDYIVNHVAPLIEKTLKTCIEIWDNRYEKHYSEIIKQAE